MTTDESLLSRDKAIVPWRAVHEERRERRQAAAGPSKPRSAARFGLGTRWPFEASQVRLDKTLADLRVSTGESRVG